MFLFLERLRNDLSKINFTVESENVQNSLYNLRKITGKNKWEKFGKKTRKKRKSSGKIADKKYLIFKMFHCKFIPGLLIETGSQRKKG